jgi:hypothetical protein
MELVKDVELIYERINSVRKASKKFVTNFFYPKDKVQSIIDRKLLFERRYKGTSFFFRKDRHFYHLYFNSDAIFLRNALTSVMSDIKSTIVADLIGMEKDVDELLTIFLDVQFTPYASLFRMAKIIDNYHSNYEKDINIEFAKKKDVSIIHHLLYTLFDPYSEQIPTVEEIRLAVMQGNILMIKDDGNISGFLFYERTGLTSLLRYWFVNETNRDQKYGAKLMHTYFALTKMIKRYVLWVIDKNTNAIIKYHHYGYKADNLTNQVVIKIG